MFKKRNIVAVNSENSQALEMEFARKKIAILKARTEMLLRNAELISEWADAVQEELKNEVQRLRHAVRNLIEEHPGWSDEQKTQKKREILASAGERGTNGPT